jgi:hypothetical protein
MWSKKLFNDFASQGWDWCCISNPGLCPGLLKLAFQANSGLLNKWGQSPFIPDFELLGVL